MKKIFAFAVIILGFLVLVAPAQDQSQYEVWIVAKKPNGRLNFINDSGHAFIALVKNLGQGWEVESTYGFWSTGNFQTSNPSEISDVKSILRGQPISIKGQAVRKSRIGVNRFNWIKDNPNLSGCSKYVLVGGIGSECNCMDYATRMWHVLSSERDDFRIRFISIDITLYQLVDAINAKNRDTGDFIDGGNIWR
jgi:hypothetical protein